MGDGDNATPGQHRASDPEGDNQWLTRSTRPTPGAAPWERGDDVENDDEAPEGNHTGGVTVADLFAKVTGDVPASLQRGGAKAASDLPESDTSEPEPYEHDEPRNEAIHEARAGHDADPPTIPTLSAYASEIPDQAELAPRRSAPSRDIEKTTVLPVVVDNLPAIIDKRPLARIGEKQNPVPPARRRARRSILWQGVRWPHSSPCSPWR